MLFLTHIQCPNIDLGVSSNLSLNYNQKIIIIIIITFDRYKSTYLFCFLIVVELLFGAAIRSRSHISILRHSGCHGNIFLRHSGCRDNIFLRHSGCHGNILRQKNSLILNSSFYWL